MILKDACPSLFEKDENCFYAMDDHLNMIREYPNIIQADEVIQWCKKKLEENNIIRSCAYVLDEKGNRKYIEISK